MSDVSCYTDAMMPASKPLLLLLITVGVALCRSDGSFRRDRMLDHISRRSAEDNVDSDYVRVTVGVLTRWVDEVARLVQRLPVVPKLKPQTFWPSLRRSLLNKWLLARQTRLTEPRQAAVQQRKPAYVATENTRNGKMTLFIG